MTEHPPTQPYPLGSVIGVELEYMIVGRESLDVRPISDVLLRAASDSEPDDIERGEISWSNELVAHVIELKTTWPAKSLTGWSTKFHADIVEMNRQLEPHGAMLLPTGMHPWMEPDRELRLWAHGYSEVYQAFDRIFDCRGHGWANLQSVHLNLPFQGDAEFARLHGAIRAILPLLPALAASSPVCEGRVQPNLDQRLYVYCHNARRIQAVTGEIIPEPVYSEQAYRAVVLDPLFEQIRPHDPDGVLQDEFLNARGAIARFSRGSIEIRLLDIAEAPVVDIAIAAAIRNVIDALCQERWASLAAVQALPTSRLRELLMRGICRAEQTPVDFPELLAIFGWHAAMTPTMGELWSYLLRDAGGMPREVELQRALERVLTEGPLARRLVRALGEAPTREQLRAVYRQLADSLQANEIFSP